MSSENSIEDSNPQNKVFKNTEERLNLELDFFGTQILEAEEDNAGFCLVINHKDLQCDKDIHEIGKLFSGKLHYLCRRFSFTTTQNLKDMICEKLEMFKDCHEQIVVFVFCHGNNNLIQTNDGSIKCGEFRELFLPGKFPRISEKPKLFFLIQKEVQVENSEKVNEDNSGNIPQQSNSKKVNDLIGENIPELSNVYWASLTSDGFDSLNGTPCVQALLKVIEEDPKLEITDLKTETCNKMKELFQSSLTMNVNDCLVQYVRFDTTEFGC